MPLNKKKKKNSFLLMVLVNFDNLNRRRLVLEAVLPIGTVEYQISKIWYDF